jgi:RND family efflux transporter MFP subunit
MSRAALLAELKMDTRAPVPAPSKRPPWLVPSAAGLLVAAASAAGAAAWLRPAEVSTAPALAAGRVESASPSSLEASGYVVARRSATVSSKIVGRVAEVLIEEGQTVHAGQVIARLDDSNARAMLNEVSANVAAAQASVGMAEAAERAAAARLGRSEQLFQREFVSQQAVEDSRLAAETARAAADFARKRLSAAQAAVESARRDVEDAVVRAPFDGVVTVKAAQPGEIVSPTSAGGGFTRTGIGTVVDMSSLEVEVDVAENYIQRVHDGMAATVIANAYPDWRIPARVIAVIPTADRAKGTVAVRLQLDEKDARIVPEMGVRVSFSGPKTAATAAPTQGVFVPAAAVRMTDAGPVAFVLEDGRARMQPLRLGARRGTDQVVISGLRPGQQIVLQPSVDLRDGARLRARRPAN